MQYMRRIAMPSEKQQRRQCKRHLEQFCSKQASIILFSLIFGALMYQGLSIADGQDALPITSPVIQSTPDGRVKIERQNKPVSELVADLKSPDGRVVYNAFQSLGVLGSKAEPAVPSLIELLKNPDAGFIVKNFHPPGHILGPSQKFIYADQSRQTLFVIGPAAAPQLLKALDDKSPALQRNASLVLGHLAQEGRLGAQVDQKSVKKSVSEYLQTYASKLSVDDLKKIGFTKAPEAEQELILRLQKKTTMKPGHGRPWLWAN
jgi:hypothetical protein